LRTCYKTVKYIVFIKIYSFRNYKTLVVIPPIFCSRLQYRMKHELTVTLRPVLYDKTPQQQFDITSQYMKTALFPYKATCVAELTHEHNVHYHCLVEVEGILDKNKLLNRFRQFNKHLGRKTCSAVQYEESYEKYLIKSYQDTAKILPDPFVKDDYKISNLLNKDLFYGKAQRQEQGQEGTGWKEVSGEARRIPCLGVIRTENPVRSDGYTHLSEARSTKDLLIEYLNENYNI